MRRIDCFNRRVALCEEKMVVKGEKASERTPKEERDPAARPLHECVEGIDVHSEMTAEQEDEDVVQDPVVEPIHEKWLKQ